LIQYFIEAEWLKLHSVTLVKLAVEFDPKTQKFTTKPTLESHKMQQSKEKAWIFKLNAKPILT